VAAAPNGLSRLIVTSGGYFFLSDTNVVSITTKIAKVKTSMMFIRTTSSPAV
jgi:hypothetical protein